MDKRGRNRIKNTPSKVYHDRLVTQATAGGQRRPETAERLGNLLERLGNRQHRRWMKSLLRQKGKLLQGKLTQGNLS